MELSLRHDCSFAYTTFNDVNGPCFGNELIYFFFLFLLCEKKLIK